MTEENARDVAIAALQYLAANQDMIARFFALTGMGADELRASVGEKETLAAILEALLQDENSVLAFSENASLDPMSVRKAHAVLDPSSYSTEGWEY